MGLARLVRQDLRRQSPSRQRTVKYCNTVFESRPCQEFDFQNTSKEDALLPSAIIKAKGEVNLTPATMGLELQAVVRHKQA